MDHHHHHHHHHHSKMSVSAGEVGGSQALTWLLPIMIIGMFAIGESRSSDIECLRSIKESLQDPQKQLSNWVFNDSSEADNFICSFNGVHCDDDSSPVATVRVIRLTGMGLSGEFPRGIANCESLVGLSLSNNHLNGSIPSDISRLLTYVNWLDLSYNTFSGEIPPDIAKCLNLSVLRLNNNLLTGPIPPLLASLKGLKSFTVANNLLSGRLPRFLYASFPSQSYANNTGLCGRHPLEPCQTRKAEFVGGFFAGWGISFTLVLVVRFFKSFRKHTIDYMKRKLNATPRDQSLTLIRRADNNIISRLERFATRMSLGDLRQATDNFSEKNVIAIGEVGITYKAVLPNGWVLAVKRLSSDFHIEHVFLSEILTLGRLKHRNLVPLFGFCQVSNDRFLIYKYMPRGSLHDCLFSCEGEAKSMEWPVRAKIAVRFAKGIAWLHLNRVVHRGISSKCILLDEDFNPRISDFGRATTLSPNNLSWESSFSNGEISVLGSYEEDVHSFGKVLLELITGTKYNEIISSFDIDANMFEQISHLLNEAGPPGACVQSMMEKGFGDEISCFLRVAGKCLECDPHNWPSMAEVCEMLTGKSRHDAVDGSEIEIEFANIQNN